MLSSIMMKRGLWAGAFLLGLTASAQATVLNPFASSIASSQTTYDWISNWGMIDYSSDNDPIIPSSLMPVKGDIESVTGLCGTAKTQAALSTLRVDAVDFNSDGYQDYLIDGNGYFTNFFAGAPPCDTNLCTAAEGCYISLYLMSAPTNLIAATPAPTVVEETVVDDPVVTDDTTSSPSSSSDDTETSSGSDTSTDTTSTPFVPAVPTTPTTHTKTTLVYPTACPETAEDNTSCLNYCAATQKNCPALFQYNSRMVYSARVKTWKFISATDFAKMVTGIQGYALTNANPVMVVLYAGADTSKCYASEISINNNQCIKYFQYAGDMTTGKFVDLYSYNPNESAENGNAFTYVPFNRTTMIAARGEVMGGGFGLKLAANGGTINLQLTTGGTTTPQCASLVNTSSNNYFVPTNTDMEFSAFMTHLPDGVALTSCGLFFTDWIGDTDCATYVYDPAHGVMRGQVISIAAQRFCQRSSGAYAPCSECVNAKVGDYQKGCLLQQQCTGVGCIAQAVVTGDSQWSGGSGDAFRYLNGRFITPTVCQQADVYAMLVRLVNAGYWGGTMDAACNTFMNDFCAEGGHFCLAAESLIALPEGKTLRLDMVKAGDTVLGFDKVKGALHPVKVKIIALTDDQPSVKLNGALVLTKNHPVYLMDGRHLAAGELKPGMKLVDQVGKALLVKTVESLPQTLPVYNLQLESGIGFVADGVRVVSYKAP